MIDDSAIRFQIKKNIHVYIYIKKRTRLLYTTYITKKRRTLAEWKIRKTKL